MNTTHLVLWAVCSAGCVNEYHPEYHPVSIVSVSQGAPPVETAAPVQRVVAPYASRSVVALHTARPEPDYTKLFTHDAGDPFAISEQYVRPEVQPETRIGRGVIIGGNVQFNGNVTINGDVYIDAHRQ